MRNKLDEKWPKRRELFNGYEQLMLEVIEENFPIPYKCYPQVRLASALIRNRYFDREEYGFYLKSSVDILVINSIRIPILAVECQSSHHDSDEIESRDKLKLKLLSENKITVLYTRPDKHYLDNSSYKIWNPISGEGCFLSLNSSKKIHRLENILGDEFYKALEAYENLGEHQEIYQYKSRYSYSITSIIK